MSLPSRGLRATRRRSRRARREAVLVLATMFGYFGLRLVVEGDRSVAVRNARRLLDLEERLGIDIEHRVQSWVLDHGVVEWVLTNAYVWLHWPLLIAVMVFLTLRAPEVQARLRNAFAASATVGVVLFAALPMAPPRFMPDYVGTVSDAARRHYLPYSLDWTNQFAAFPSYHVGWTLIACVAAFGVARSRWTRAGLVAAAALVAVSVVGTGNHYLLDSLTGAALALAAWFVAGRVATRGPVRSNAETTVPVPPSTPTTAPSGTGDEAPVATTPDTQPRSRDTITA